jgi:hypothetical protein
MHTVHLGSQAEYVHISVPAAFDQDGWAQVQVEVAVQCFRGSVRPYLERPDLERFTRDLAALHASLSGRAELSPVEGQFGVTLVGNGRGGVSVSGFALANASYGSKLQYEFELDQTFLPPVVAELKALLAGGARASA